MKTRWHILALLSGLVLQPAFADPADQPEAGHAEHRRNLREAVSDGKLGPNEAARRAQKQRGGGRVLAIEAAEGGYRVKLLQKGDVHIVFVPEQ